MEHAPFTITIDAVRKFVRVVMRGSWNDEVIARYDQEIHAAGMKLAAVGCAREEVLALVDVRGAGAQTGDVVAAYRERFARPERQPRRLATIVSSALLKRQVERIAMPNQRIFDDETDAMRWLFSPEGQ